MFGTVMLPATNFKRLLRSEPPSAEYARVQAFLQQQNFLIAFDASELLLCFQESSGRPAQRLISFSPAFYVACHPLHRSTGHDSIALVVDSFRRNTAPILTDYLWKLHR